MPLKGTAVVSGAAATGQQQQPTAITSAGQGSDKFESDKAFLERVRSILNNLLETLNHHQPEDPLQFIHSYFQSLQIQEDPVKIAHDRLKDISLQSDAFDDCLLEVYNMLIKSAVTEISQFNNSLAIYNKKSVPKFLFGDLFNRLLDLLVSDLEANVQKIVGERLKRKEYDSFSFKYFKSSIKLVFLLKEYLNEATLLYKDLATYSNPNKVNRVVCECLLDRLQDTIKLFTEKGQQPSNEKVLETIFDLSPAGLSAYLVENNYRMTQCKETISLDGFLNAASKHFINSITL